MRILIWFQILWEIIKLLFEQLCIRNIYLPWVINPKFESLRRDRRLWRLKKERKRKIPCNLASRKELPYILFFTAIQIEFLSQKTATSTRGKISRRQICAFEKRNNRCEKIGKFVHIVHKMEKRNLFSQWHTFTWISRNDWWISNFIALQNLVRKNV